MVSITFGFIRHHEALFQIEINKKPDQAYQQTVSFLERLLQPILLPDIVSYNSKLTLLIRPVKYMEFSQNRHRRAIQIDRLCRFSVY